MKQLLVLTMLVLTSLFAGCSATVHSNVPFHTTTVTVTNATDYTLSLVKNGTTVRENLGRGEHYPVDLWNSSNASAEVGITIKAYDKNGRMVSAVADRVSVDGYYRRSETWIVEPSYGGGIQITRR